MIERIGAELGQLQHGDGRTHTEHLALVHETLAAIHNAEEDPIEIMRIATALRQGIADLRTFVDSDPQLAARAKISSRLSEADALSAGRSMDMRVAARLAMFGGQIQVASDVDNTITTNGTYLEATIPGSTLAEPILKKRGREAFPEVFAKTWRLVLLHNPDLFRHGGESDLVQVREGVSRFFAYLQEQGAPRMILSANFLPFVEGALGSKTTLLQDPDLQVYANTANDIRSTDKGAYLHKFAQADTSRALIYIGDGASDIPALEASDTVACYFALAGSEFEAALRARNIPHYSYRDFDDIRVQLSKLQRMAQSATIASAAALSI